MDNRIKRDRLQERQRQIKDTINFSNQKLVIKDVVLYAENKISATKHIVKTKK